MNTSLSELPGQLEQYRVQFEESLNNPEFLKFASSQAMRMFHLLSKFDQKSNLPDEFLERAQQAKKKGFHFELGTSFVPGRERLQYLDISMTFPFETIEEIDDISKNPYEEKAYKFCFDLFCTYKAMDLISQKSQGALKNQLERIKRDLLLTRTSGKLDQSWGCRTFKQYSTGQMIFALRIKEPESGHMYDDFSYRILNIAHEVMHALFPTIFEERAFALERIQDPLAGKEKYFSGTSGNPSVENIIDESIAILGHKELSGSLEGGADFAERISHQIDNNNSIIHKIADKLSEELIRRGLNLSLLPTFLAKLREELDDKDLYFTYENYGDRARYDEVISRIISIMKTPA